MTSLLNQTIKRQWTLRNAVPHYEVLQFKYAASTVTDTTVTLWNVSNSSKTWYQ